MSALAFGQNSTSLQRKLVKLATDSELRSATLGFYAMYIDSTTTLASHLPDVSLVPASSLKVLTTAAILETLGPEHQFSTTTGYRGRLDTISSNGDTTIVLLGDLWLIGGGDPALGSKYFKKHYGKFFKKWAKQVAALGIDSISGRVIADDRIFPPDMVPSTWIWGDMGNYYGAGPSGLSVYDNLFEVAFKSGPAPGDPTKVKHIVPEVPGMTIHNRVVAADIDHDQAYLFGAPYQMERYATGRIPRGQNNFVVKGSIPNPPLLAAQEWHRALTAAGIAIHLPPTSVQQGAESDTLLLDTLNVLKSPPLVDLVQKTNMRSLNLFCEHFVLHLCIANGVPPSTGAGTRLMTEYWAKAGVRTKGMYLNDGSGLSRFNAITARQLAGVMAEIYAGKYKKEMLSSLPVAGVSGSLAGLCRGTAAEGNLQAKSGYMTRVRSYSGIVHSKSGRPIAFAMMANNYTCSAYQMKLKLQQLMIALANTE